jgi:hypothetical protein
MKKLIAVLASVIISLPLFSIDFELSLMPQVDFHLQSYFQTSVSGALSFDVYPFTFFERNKVGFSLQGGLAAIKAQTLNTSPLYYGDLALNYYYRFSDRFAAGLQSYAGLWTYPPVKEKNTESMSGILFGSKVFADFYILPEFKAGLFFGFSDFYYRPEAFTKRLEAGINLKYSFSKGIFGKSGVVLDEYNVEPVFPVFYSFYNDNSFGKVSFYNEEENKITDVSISVLIPEYMVIPKECGHFDVIERNQAFEVDLRAFLNETILESLALHSSEGKVIVSYRSLGKKVSYEKLIDFSILSRNSMNWDDDRKAAAFVSSHDGAANKISKYAKTLILKNPQNDYSFNMQMARALFATLKAYGLSYVRDPTSPFSSEATRDVDFLQFPYQTLLYSGGDCDDLAILNCALFESVGISTAFITVPGHIFMAFDSGLSVEKAPSVITDGRYIVQDGKVWIPLEITCVQESFAMERSAGYNQWKNSSKKGEAKLYPLSDAWKLYKPVSIPESDAQIDLPAESLVIKYLKN